MQVPTLTYNTTNLKTLRKQLFKLSEQLEKELRQDGKLCGLTGHMVIGRYNLRGNFDEVVNSMQQFRNTLMTSSWNLKGLLNVARTMDERCNEFVTANFIPDNALTNRLHKAKQCMCHANH